MIKAVKCILANAVAKSSKERALIEGDGRGAQDGELVVADGVKAVEGHRRPP